MSPWILVFGGGVVGIVIGWILATEIIGLAWKRLAQFQKNTVKAQREVIEVRKGLSEREEQVTTWIAALKKKEAEIEQEWKKAVAANQEALRNMKEVNELKDKTVKEWTEAVAAREEAIVYNDQVIQRLEKSTEAESQEKQQS